MAFQPSTFTFQLTARGRARRGFALLITITLLAFLVVLLVGLASYMRVETSIAGNTQRQTQARQNALMALDVALGQLQKYAGPDQRVTATAEARPASETAKPYATRYVGVWDTTQSATTTPLTWLVSGNEFQSGAAPLAKAPTITLTTSGTAPTAAELVGKNSTGTASSVIAPLVAVTAVGVPGNSSVPGPTIGRYAWWVGDQGVKAPVALGDPTATVSNFNYAPYTSAELLSRIRQQISLGAGATDAAGNTVFEPRDTNNKSLVANSKVAAYNQLAFLKNPAGTALGLTPLKTYFHTWSPNNFAVLANTKLGGLRQDLSLFSPANPSPLGAAYDAWANYDPANGGYMEDFTNPTTPAPLQPYASDPLRRRYVMQPATSAYGISPVLTYFSLSFSLRNDDSTHPTQFELASRCVVGLWNPYTSSLVPDGGGYQLRVTGLPQIVVTDGAGETRNVDLATALGAPFNLVLPWTPDGTNDDRSSWLPGRVYNWASVGNTSDPGGNGNPMSFYDNSAAQGNGMIRALGAPLVLSPNNAPVYRVCTGPSVTLKIELWRLSDGVKLADFTSLPFDPIQTSDGVLQTDYKYIDFAFVFRMPDALEIPAGASATWLQASGRDPREPSFPTTGYVAAGNSPNPAVFGGVGKVSVSASNSSLLLDRYPTGGSSYNEDVPLFELPRSPLLSVGELQHLRISGARPFTIGNSWTSGVQLSGINVSELFDRFFFSGLTTNVTPSSVNGSLVLPNPLLKVIARNSATGAATTLTDLQTVPNEKSGKFLLQGGAFNVNSVSVPAWSAVLRSARFATGTNLNVLNVDSATGTAVDGATATPSELATSAADATTAAFYQTMAANLPVAVFFRFPQSAQETLKADDNYPQSQSSFAGAGPAINTPLYRRGARTLAASEVTSLANAIVALVRQRQAATGPFVSVEDFLSPASSGGAGVLEQAIADANLNANVAEFSSQWLTQADIMTALAPVLFPRSDTFVIRTYGEAVNPTTAATEGRAWCEAIVQRVPDYFDSTTATGDAAEVAPTALVSTLNQTLGRRFKIISFRWLTRSDI